MSTLPKESSLIDAHFHPTGPIPDSYIGCAIGPFDIDKIGVYSTYGIHPWDIEQSSTFTPPPTRRIIGEVGLDRQKQYLSTFQAQLSYLKAALHHAESQNVPIVLHCVRAFDDLCTLLKRQGRIHGYIHGYIGSYEQAQRIQRANSGLFFGFSPRAENSPKTMRCFEQLPLSQILIETDSEPNPRLLTHSYQMLATLKGLSVPEINSQMQLNFQRWLAPLCRPASPSAD